LYLNVFVPARQAARTRTRTSLGQQSQQQRQQQQQKKTQQQSFTTTATSNADEGGEGDADTDTADASDSSYLSQAKTASSSSSNGGSSSSSSKNGNNRNTSSNSNSNGNNKDQAGLLPVMVWLHGGAFRSGGARRAEYNGQRLAARGVVVVTLNYRLGALGFLVSSPDGLFGNFGLMDQRAALYWIRNNIIHFGGDANNVMLFGESAGAVMTVLHLMMEEEHNDVRLVHKAAIQSNPLGLQFRSVVVADFIGEALKQSMDCRDLACLRAERVEEIMRAQSTLMGVPRSVGDFFTWGPTLTNELRLLTLGSGGRSSSSSSSGSSSAAVTTSPGGPSAIISARRAGTAPTGFSPLSREYVIFRDLDSWKWQQQHRRGGRRSINNSDRDWALVNVTQPLKDFGRIPDDVPILIGTNKHEGEMFVHGAFPITMSKAVYWMFVGTLLYPHPVVVANRGADRRDAMRPCSSLAIFLSNTISI
jgi:acetyl esterase/lipase